MKWLCVLAASLTLALAFGGQAFAQIQMTSTGTNYGSDASTFSPIDQEHWVATTDQMGVRVDDSGKGPFHLISTDIRLLLFGDKSGVHYHGYYTMADKDGDKLMWEIWDFPAGSRTGKGKVIGATGKFSGIEGTMDYELMPTPKGFPWGTGRTIAKEVVKLTLKNPL